ncbi:PH and SEC7 domain-containing protein isoform X2 [Frankliniella occidentalis]|uniref:PH and SEC7 domain-containing protein isoform X2 n=1 Tax=Frankliniella occidentalis TaxID=133901 RepID=A0A6J1T3K5_FRAOC|nr:PH and SEC7 domain-containing protein isoform X2 [Frankliniella occidentalis]
MAAQELVVTLSKQNDSAGLGFSLLGLSGLPHVIYDIVEHSAAADSGQVEAGDIILRVNDADVSRLTTKEVLKCVRLSKDPVRLTLKRDPVLKAKVLCHITSPHAQDAEDLCELISSTSSSSSSSTSSPSFRSSKIPRPKHGLKHNNGSAIPTRTSGSSVTSPVLKERNGGDTRKNAVSSSDKNEVVWEPLGGPAEKLDKSGPPRFEAYMMTGDLILNLSRTQQSSVLPKQNKKVDSLLLRHHHNYQNHRHNSVPTSPNESDLGIKGHKLDSPTCNSAGTSPVGASKHELFQEHASSTCSSGKLLTYHNSVRTSRSEDQLQKDSSISTVDIDIDEDVTSSLNTLLDTKSESNQSCENECFKNRFDRFENNTKGDEQSPVLDHKENIHHCKEDTKTNNSTTNHNSKEEHQTVFAQSLQSSDGDRQKQGYSLMSQPDSTIIEQSCRAFKGESHNEDIPEAHTWTDSVTSSSAHSALELIQTHGDRIVWTYNAPDWWIRLHGDRMPRSIEELEQCQRQSMSITQMSSSSSGGSDSTRDGVESPTSISSSVMSSNSSNVNQHPINPLPQRNGDFSQSEAISNISSPDFQEETLDILSARDLLMEGSDASDSDSTLMASIPRDPESSHRIVIEVKGPDKDGIGSPQKGKSGRPQIYQELRENQDSPPLSEDESDIESLHSYHYSPKGVDLPSAIRLAKRLYMLDGFKKSDISKHLCKNNDFSRAVADEYLKHFDFSRETLDISLRKFLRQFSLTGETQERERVLVHFSKRYLDCNPGSFNSQDAVHTLTCAIMLLNTDLHTQNVGRKMSCVEFIDNLAELNDGDNFPREVLKLLYQAIKMYPLEWALDGDGDECVGDIQAKQQAQQQSVPQRGTQGGLGSFCNLGMNPFLDVPNAASAIEYKKGYVMRKCCVDANGKRTPFGKRGWRMYCCTLRDMVLYLHKDEHGFRKNQLSDNLHNAIRIHHALATKATDYTKKQHVFRLQTADQAEYLFQTSDSKELQSWIDTINFVCASFSSQPLASAVGSQKKFQRPLLPCSHTKLNLREQLRDHEERVLRIEAELEELRKGEKDGNSNKSLNAHGHKERDIFLQHELKRYKTYAYLLRSRMSHYPELVEPLLDDSRFAEAITEEESPCSPPSNRYSYRAAIYNSSMAGPARSGVESYAAELG